MRIWDIAPHRLCRKHLVAEHAEIHAAWSVLTTEKQAYAAHPEVRRWRGRLHALYRRHGLVATEMARRGFAHRSDLQPRLATGLDVQDTYLDAPDEQERILIAKGCGCAALE